MSRKKDGGAAFPRPGFTATEYDSQEGMSLRDWFAGMVLSPMLVQAYGNTPDALAEKAYEMADAMLKAREE